MKRLALIAGVLMVACGGGTEMTPGTEVSCTDNEDEDIDGATDCDDADCSDDPACLPVGEVCTGGVDEDGDTLIDCEDDGCFDDAACFDVDDPTDLPGPNGDPSVDLDKVGVELVNGVATFFATTDGTWPPATDTYSWFVLVEIDNDGNTPLASATIQRHDGVDSTIPTGVPAQNITVRQTPVGLWVRITGVPAGGVNYYVESGIQKTNPGTRVTDTIGGAPQPLP